MTTDQRDPSWVEGLVDKFNVGYLLPFANILAMPKQQLRSIHFGAQVAVGLPVPINSHSIPYMCILQTKRWSGKTIGNRKKTIGHLVGGPFFLNHSIASQSGQWVIRTIRLRFLCIEHAETHWLDRLNQSTADFSGQLWKASCACTLPRRYGQELLGCSRGISLHRESIYFEDLGAPSEPPDQPTIYNFTIRFNP